MKKYFIDNPVGHSRTAAFLKYATSRSNILLQAQANKRSTTAGSFSPANRGLTYRQLATINAERVMRLAAPFAGKNNQTKDNLVHLKQGQVVGEWRDSTYGR